MSRELLQQALKAIHASHEYTIFDVDFPEEFKPIVEAIEAELAKPEQEPVAWMLPEYGDVLSAAEVGGKPGIYNIPLYTAPPKREWVGLTELEVKHYNNRLSGSNVAQEIESKLRERNT
jgi:hypothetical protein